MTPISNPSLGVSASDGRHSDDPEQRHRGGRKLLQREGLHQRRQVSLLDFGGKMTAWTGNDAGKRSHGLNVTKRWLTLSYDGLASTYMR